MQAAQYTHLSALVFALAHRSIGPWIAACCKQRLGIANRLRCLWDRLEAGNVPLLCFYYANRLPAGTRLVLLLDPNDAARQVLAVALRWLRPNSSFIVIIILLAGSTARCRHGARFSTAPSDNAAWEGYCEKKSVEKRGLTEYNQRNLQYILAPCKRV